MKQLYHSQGLFFSSYVRLPPCLQNVKYIITWFLLISDASLALTWTWSNMNALVCYLIIPDTNWKHSLSHYYSFMTIKIYFYIFCSFQMHDTVRRTTTKSKPALLYWLLEAYELCVVACIYWATSDIPNTQKWNIFLVFMIYFQSSGKLKGENTSTTHIYFSVLQYVGLDLIWSCFSPGLDIV